MRAFETMHLLYLCLCGWTGESAKSQKEGMIDDAHAFDRLCDDASDNTLEEESISIIKDV